MSPRNELEPDDGVVLWAPEQPPRFRCTCGHRAPAHRGRLGGASPCSACGCDDYTPVEDECPFWEVDGIHRFEDEDDRCACGAWPEEEEPARG